jgi:hypothetical protein
MKIRLPVFIRNKPFKYLSTAKDYPSPIGRYITNEDRIVATLNQLKENLEHMEINSKLKEEENCRLLQNLYVHCKVLSDKVKFLEEKLYAQNYQ